MLPFLDIVQDRTHFNWAGIGFIRLSTDLFLWAVVWLAPRILSASRRRHPNFWSSHARFSFS
jgi:hypothetical protein